MTKVTPSDLRMDLRQMGAWSCVVLSLSELWTGGGTTFRLAHFCHACVVMRSAMLSFHAFKWLVITDAVPLTE
jgi:hypothetical protein